MNPVINPVPMAPVHPVLLGAACVLLLVCIYVLTRHGIKRILLPLQRHLRIPPSDAASTFAQAQQSWMRQFPEGALVEYACERRNDSDVRIGSIALWHATGNKPAPATTARPCIVVSFGNVMTLDSWGERVASVVAEQCPEADVWMWDYGGCGRSSGPLDPSLMSQDARSVWNVVRTWYFSKIVGTSSVSRPLVFWGHSLGTFAASVMAHAASHDVNVSVSSAVSHVVVSAGFASLGMVSLLPAVFGFAMEPQALIRELPPSVHLRLVHGRNDEIFSLDHPEALAAARGTSSVTQTIVPNSDHNTFSIIATAAVACVAANQS
jgi:hypothetical protein